MNCLQTFWSLILSLILVKLFERATQTTSTHSNWKTLFCFRQNFKNSNRIVLTSNHGGSSIMVWIYFESASVGELVYTIVDSHSNTIWIQLSCERRISIAKWVAWDNVTNEELQKLVNRMQRICRAVIKVKRVHFDEKSLFRLIMIFYYLFDIFTLGSAR